MKPAQGHASPIVAGARRRSWRLCALLVAALLCLPAASHAEVAEAGQPPPLFALPDETGRVHDLKELLGQPIVLYFTHNMCHYCTQVIAFLKRTRERYSEEQLTILTINVWADGPKLIRRYKEQFGLPFPMLAGKDPQLLRDYEVNYVPIIVFIGTDGRIHRLFHHYILAADFEATVKEVAGEATAPPPEEPPGP